LTVGCPLLGASAYLMYTSATSDPWIITFLYTLAGFAVGVVAVVPYVMIALFSPKIRFSGISFSYNIAYAIFGGLTPVVVAWLLRFDRLAPAHYVGALSLLGLGIGVFTLRKVRVTESSKASRLDRQKAVFGWAHGSNYCPGEGVPAVWTS
jgi:hypothetical protein